MANTNDNTNESKTLVMRISMAPMVILSAEHNFKVEEFLDHIRKDVQHYFYELEIEQQIETTCCWETCPYVEEINIH